jgi:NAD(P)H-hydrate repair Nnr-like enzyme with NAD(P)H-hydrate epimerase domain
MDRARGEVEESGENREKGRWLLLVGLGKNAGGEGFTRRLRRKKREVRETE